MNVQGFGYTFPFPIVCADDIESWSSLTRIIDGIKVEIHPPFLSGRTVRITQDFDINISPSFIRRGISIPDSSIPLSGFRTVPQCFGENSSHQPIQCEANAFQIEFQTGSEMRAGQIESWLVRSGLRNMRRSSGQFWIEHPAVYFEGFKRVQYKVTSGMLDHGIWSTSTVYSGNLRMQVIDFRKWKDSWLSARKEYDTDYYDSLLLAEHQLAGNFLFDATMSCALAIEKCKYSLWEKILDYRLCSPAQEKAARNDTSKPERYFSTLLPAEIDFQPLSQNHLLSISEAWIARGIISHGKERNLSKSLKKTLDREIINNWVNDLWEVGRQITNFSIR